MGTFKVGHNGFLHHDMVRSLMRPVECGDLREMAPRGPQGMALLEGEALME